MRRSHDLTVLALLCVVLDFANVVVTFLALRGSRAERARVVPLPLALLAMLGAGALAIAAMNEPLLGVGFSTAFALVPTAFCCVVAYCAVVLVQRRRYARRASPGGWWKTAIASGLSAVLVVVALVSGRGRPAPERVVASSTHARFDGSLTGRIQVEEGPIRVTGPHVEAYPADGSSPACWLEVTNASSPSHATGRIPLSPPWGLSGTRVCGSGDVHVSSSAGIIMVSEEPPDPTRLLSWARVTRTTSLDTMVTTEEPPTAIALGTSLAPPLGFVGLAALGTVAAGLSLLGARGERRQRREPGSVVGGPYRIGPSVDPADSGSAEAPRTFDLPAPAVIALASSAPLLVALIERS